MARDYVLQCGNNTCTRFRLCYFFDTIGQILKYPPTKLVLSKEMAEIARRISQTIPARLVQQRAMRRSSGGNTFRNDHTSEPVPRPLLNLYAENKAAECQDSRDKIFGLHSLASACCKKEIPVDYSLPLGEVLRTLVRHQASHPSIAPKAWGETPQPTIKEYQEIYRTMASISRDYDQEKSSAKFAFAINNFIERIEENDLSTKPKVHGYIRGRIYYSTPLFSSRSVTTTTVPVPKITSWTEIQLRHICSQFGKRDSGFAPSRRTTRSGNKLALSLRPRRRGTRVAPRHPHITSELDLVGSLSARSIAYRDSYTPFFENLMQGIKMPRIAPGNATSQNFMNLLCDARRASSGKDVVLALEETGLIVFAPPSTKVGDLVCQFPDSDILALIRLDRSKGNPYCYSTARVVNFLAAPPTTTAALCGKAEIFCDRDKKRGILLPLDTPEIMRLCKPSKTPNGKHNIPTEGVGDGRV